MARLYDRQVDLTKPGRNTLLELQYRDADNNKVSRVLVLPGRLSAEQFARLEAGENEDGFIIPSQVGLPDLQGSFEGSGDWDDAADHVWHSLQDISLTDAPATVSMTVAEMMEKWPSDPSDWNEVDIYRVLSGQAPASILA